MSTPSRAITLWRRLLLAACITGALLPCDVDAQQRSTTPDNNLQLGEPNIRFDFDVAPQPLTTALEKFGVITGVQLFYDSRLVAGRMSPGVVGRFTASDALARLLAHTSLGLVGDNSGMVSLDCNSKIQLRSRSRLWRDRP